MIKIALISGSQNEFRRGRVWVEGLVFHNDSVPEDQSITSCPGWNPEPYEGQGLARGPSLDFRSSQFANLIFDDKMSPQPRKKKGNGEDRFQLRHFCAVPTTVAQCRAGAIRFLHVTDFHSHRPPSQKKL